MWFHENMAVVNRLGLVKDLRALSKIPTLLSLCRMSLVPVTSTWPFVTNYRTYVYLIVRLETFNFRFLRMYHGTM